MPRLEHVDAVERRPWSAADTLRANSKYAGNEYFLPVMGRVFLRHACSRYLAVRDEIEAGLPTRGGRKRAVTRVTRVPGADRPLWFQRREDQSIKRSTSGSAA